MEKLTSREHDFGAKLRQTSTIERLREYVTWQRSLRTGQGGKFPDFGPTSVNLDLTMACNFACPHCVDSSILNHRKSLSFDSIRQSLRTLQSKGLLSVILLGGGEPTLHRDFEKVVQEIKNRKLQVGIVTNGSRLERASQIVDRLEEKDWIRISMDAATEETFWTLHRPRTGVTLKQILESARKIKERNPRVSLGYSFVIVWEGIEIRGGKLVPNIREMAESVRWAKEYTFDYVSFKPCLVRLETSEKEALLDQVDPAEERRIVEEIRANLEEAKRVAEGQVRILESVNLQAMLRDETDRIKKQPKQCHMPFFRTVVSPSGIFHCPAFRGVERAKIAERDGYLTEDKFRESLLKTALAIQTFDAEEECKVVGCFYHHTNWWLEELIQSTESVDRILQVEDDNFFL